MAANAKFAIYFSHSWRPRDVPLNLRVWDALRDQSQLVVDEPDEAGGDPPYYVNRIQELLRRSDVFVGVLTRRENEKARTSDGPDSLLDCSMFGLFEIRLAERSGLPRMVLYERSTGFKPPQDLRPSEVYIAFDRVASDALPEGGKWARVHLPKIQQWLKWVIENRQPNSYDTPTIAVLAMAPQLAEGKAAAAAECALRNGGFDSVHLVDPSKHDNIEAFRLLHCAGLVLADVGGADPACAALHGAVEALGIPAIRTLQESGEIPWLLRGHPGGYQKDLLRWKTPEELLPYVEARAHAMFGVSRGLDETSARAYLSSKRFAEKLIFLSHTLKPPNRTLVERVCDLLGQAFVKPFEYHMDNKSGEDWKLTLDQQLAKATHFVALLTEGYEVSEFCTYELDRILARKKEVKILPFLAEGRSVPHPRLKDLHHELLPLESNAAAEKVVRTVIDELGRMSPSSPRP